MIQSREEDIVASRIATERQEYIRLGLTDAALLTLASSGVELLTADLDLYLAAQRCGYNAINFNHLREFG